MLLIDNPTGRTYYEILGAKEDASYEELKTSYRSSILNSHPDKLQNTSLENVDDESQEKFLEVQKAWEILGNSRSRVAYDNKLEELRHDSFAAEEISLKDLTVEIVGEVVEMFYQCRCGDYYSIDSSELEGMGYKLFRRDESKISLQMSDALPSYVLLSCGSCSLRIHLTLNSDMEIQTDDDLSKFR
ncbi:dnaJ homolog subfamily C member 24 [Impatiens glandulifera]|uniref:dnaJ homolog subfamily C member 24 n=1 Tax=Impatiens glandulifera TaxID=253017 RepID=UPI001FB19CA4|nr:dnaJ homolog subfamily C member 24 [Impatiens glandulifera]